MQISTLFSSLALVAVATAAPGPPQAPLFNLRLCPSDDCTEQPNTAACNVISGDGPVPCKSTNSGGAYNAWGSYRFNPTPDFASRGCEITFYVNEKCDRKFDMWKDDHKQVCQKPKASAASQAQITAFFQDNTIAEFKITAYSVSCTKK